MQSSACERRPWAAAGRSLDRNAFIGPFPAGITALTGLQTLYSPCPRPPCSTSSDYCLATALLWHRSLECNRFSGSVPSAIVTMTALEYL
jgi:hypothetical protein